MSVAQQDEKHVIKSRERRKKTREKKRLSCQKGTTSDITRFAGSVFIKAIYVTFVFHFIVVAVTVAAVVCANGNSKITNVTNSDHKTKKVTTDMPDSGMVSMLYRRVYIFECANALVLRMCEEEEEEAALKEQHQKK